MPISCNPANKEAWLDVAKARASDAKTLVESDSCTIAATYMAGYVVESTLKAYCSHLGKSSKGWGRAGHNLKLIWKKSGLRLSDLQDKDGTCAFFVQEWSTDLRYCSEDDFSHDAKQLVNGALKLAKSINRHIKRSTRRNR